MGHFIFSSCVSCGVKSHQPGKMLHWQIALVRPKHLPKGKRRGPRLPTRSVAGSGLPGSEKGQHIYVLRTPKCPEPSACCSCATRCLREKRLRAQTFARYVFKVRRSRGGLGPGNYCFWVGASQYGTFSVRRSFLGTSSTRNTERPVVRRLELQSLLSSNQTQVPHTHFPHKSQL